MIWKIDCKTFILLGCAYRYTDMYALTYIGHYFIIRLAQTQI